MLLFATTRSVVKSVKVPVVELTPPDSAIDPLITSQSGVWCKRTGVSHLVVKLYSLYSCRLIRLIPYACSLAIVDNVLTVVVRECIVVFGQSLLLVRYWEWTLLQYSVVSLEPNIRIYRVCVQFLVAFHLA